MSAPLPTGLAEMWDMAKLGLRCCNLGKFTPRSLLRPADVALWDVEMKIAWARVGRGAASFFFCTTATGSRSFFSQGVPSFVLGSRSGFESIVFDNFVYGLRSVLRSRWHTSWAALPLKSGARCITAHVSTTKGYGDHGLTIFQRR